MNILYFILTIAIVAVSLIIGCVILKFIAMRYSNKRINNINEHKDKVMPYNELDEVTNDEDDDLTYKLM